MRISLADEIREISQVTPKDFDPDELHLEERDGDQTAAAEHYLLELGYLPFFSFFTLYFPHFRNLSPSALRKAQESLSDPKYSGKRVSRTQLLDDEDDDEQSPPSDSQVEDSESDDEVQEEEPSDTPESTLHQQQEPQADFTQTINQTRQEDQKKGLAVSRQLV